MPFVSRMRYKSSQGKKHWYEDSIRIADQRFYEHTEVLKKKLKGKK